MLKSSIPNILAGAVRMGRGMTTGFLLCYGPASKEVADALVLAHGRFRELRRPHRSWERASPCVRRLGAAPGETVLLAFETRKLAVEFGAFWERYARVYGPLAAQDSHPVAVVCRADQAGDARPRDAYGGRTSSGRRSGHQPQVRTS